MIDFSRYSHTLRSTSTLEWCSKGVPRAHECEVPSKRAKLKFHPDGPSRKAATSLNQVYFWLVNVCLYRQIKKPKILGWK